MTMRLRIRNETGDDVGVMLSSERRVLPDGATSDFTEEDLVVTLT